MPDAVAATVIDDVMALSEAAAIRERVVVSPCAGRFRSLPREVLIAEGEWVEPDTTLAVVVNGEGDVPVQSPFRGWVMGMLANDGQPVRPGQALFWIRGS
jgi:biotin carboxyl carrier protein